MEAARAARREDLARLGELAGDAVKEAYRGRGGPQLVGRWIDADRAGLEGALSTYLPPAPGRVLLAGTIDEEVVGVSAVRGASGSCGRVDLLFVEPAARGVGVGERLLEAALDWLREAGCSGVDALALPGDRPAKQFFESAGMVARLLTMHRSLT